MNGKRMMVAALLLMLTQVVSAQDMSKFNLYKPTEDGAKGISAAVAEAAKSGKNVFIQIGGNWCIWCARFHDFVTTDAQLDSVVKANYVVYHLNYSKENTNSELLKKYKFPQRFGFPVFLILDGKGNLLHTQNSAYLEKDKSYDKNKVMGFLLDWTVKALDPAQYKDQ